MTTELTKTEIKNMTAGCETAMAKANAMGHYDDEFQVKWVRDMLLEHVDGRMTRQDIADYVAQVDTDVRDMIPQDLYRYATAK